VYRSVATIERSRIVPKVVAMLERNPIDRKVVARMRYWSRRRYQRITEVFPSYRSEIPARERVLHNWDRALQYPGVPLYNRYRT
jgi:hypothetical protein